MYHILFIMFVILFYAVLQGTKCVAYSFKNLNRYGGILSQVHSWVTIFSLTY